MAVALVAAGCGGGGGGGGDRLSKDEFLDQADAICQRFDKQLDALGQPDNLQELEQLADDAIPIAREGIADLRALRPPEDLQDEVDRWHKLNVGALGALEDLREAARENDLGRVREIAGRATEQERQADRLAEQIGLRTCAADGD